MSRLDRIYSAIAKPMREGKRRDDLSIHFSMKFYMEIINDKSEFHLVIPHRDFGSAHSGTIFGITFYVVDNIDHPDFTLSESF